jgi:opacity protein-like surface antigen
MSAGVSLGYNLPTGDFAKKSDFDRDAAIGFGGQFGYMVNDNIQAGLSVGYAKFGGPGSGDVTLIPIMLNGRYYFTTENIMPYAGLRLGLTNENIKFPGADESAMIFSYGVMAGAAYGINDQVNLDFGVSYNLVPSDGTKFGDLGKLTADSPYIGINLGVNYKF